MGKGHLYFHWIILIAAIVVGAWSIWEDGLIPHCKNYPNPSALAMILLVIGQIAGIKAYQSQRKKPIF